MSSLTDIWNYIYVTDGNFDTLTPVSHFKHRVHLESVKLCTEGKGKGHHATGRGGSRGSR